MTLFVLLTLFQLWHWELFPSTSCAPLPYRDHCVLVWFWFGGCFQHLLTFWHQKMLQVQLVYFLHQSQNQPFLSKEPWFLLVENGNQKPRSGCQVCLLLVGCHFFQAVSTGRVRKYINIHTSVSISFPLYLYDKNHKFIRIPSIPVQHHRSHSSFSLSLFLIPFLNSEKPGFLIYNILTYLLHLKIHTNQFQNCQLSLL